MTRLGPLSIALAFGMTLIAAAARAQFDTGEQAREQQELAYQDCMILARAAPAEGGDV